MPSWVDRQLVVVPAWLDVDVGPGVLRVDIEPGAAFGLGDHPTHRPHACACSSERGGRARPCSTSAAAAACCPSSPPASGAPYVEAIDISLAAVEATSANAERNGVAGVVTASTRPLASIDEPFDVVVANLLAPVVVDLATDLRRVVAPSGALVVSGVLERAHDHVVDALAPMHVVDTVTREGWAALLVRH